MIGEMNRRITFKTWDSSKDEGGGAIAVLSAMWTIWAKVEARSGHPYTGQQQQVWDYDYKITNRYEKSRVVPSNATIEYDGKRLSINSISFENEGNRKYAVLRCRTTDQNIGTDPATQLGILTYDYYGVYHESEFTKDGTATAPPNTVRDIRNRTIIGAFKDGIEFEVLLSGIPDSNFKQVLYTPSTGNFLWSIPYEPDEHTLIQYI